MSEKKKVVIKEGGAEVFSADGNFVVRVVNGEAKVIPMTSCFIHCDVNRGSYKEILASVIEKDDKEDV